MFSPVDFSIVARYVLCSLQTHRSIAVKAFFDANVKNYPVVIWFGGHIEFTGDAVFGGITALMLPLIGGDIRCMAG